MRCSSPRVSSSCWCYALSRWLSLWHTEVLRMLVENTGRKGLHCAQSCAFDPQSCPCAHLRFSNSNLSQGCPLISFPLSNKATGSVRRVLCLSHTSGTHLQQDLNLSESVTKHCALPNAPAASQRRRTAVGWQVAALNRGGPCAIRRKAGPVAPGPCLTVLFAGQAGLPAWGDARI